MLYTGTTTDCSDALSMLRHIGASSYAAVSATFMQPVVPSMTTEDPEPAQSMPVQDPEQSKYLIPIVVMLIAMLIIGRGLVLHGLLQMQPRLMFSVQFEPYSHDTQAASGDIAQLAAEPTVLPARSKQVSMVYVACLNLRRSCLQQGLGVFTLALSSKVIV